MTQPCTFCDIVAHKHPAHIIYEDDIAIAFLDKHPITKGHALIIPKVHVPHFLDLDESVYNHCMRLVKHIGECAKDIFNPERIGIVVTGFEIPHTHIHIFPTNHPYEIKVKGLYRRFIHPAFSALEPVADAYRHALKDHPFHDTI